MIIKVIGFPKITNKYEINRVFSEHGTVKNVEKKIGATVAYVTMPYEYQGRKAIKALYGTKILEKKIEVIEWS